MDVVVNKRREGRRRVVRTRRDICDFWVFDFVEFDTRELLLFVDMFTYLNNSSGSLGLRQFGPGIVK